MLHVLGLLSEAALCPKQFRLTAMCSAERFPLQYQSNPPPQIEICPKKSPIAIRHYSATNCAFRRQRPDGGWRAVLGLFEARNWANRRGRPRYLYSYYSSYMVTLVQKTCDPCVYPIGTAGCPSSRNLIVALSGQKLGGLRGRLLGSPLQTHASVSIATPGRGQQGHDVDGFLLSCCFLSK